MNEGPPNAIKKSLSVPEQAEETNEFYVVDKSENLPNQKRSEYSDLMTKNFLNELTAEEENRLDYLTSQMSRIRSGNKVQSEEDFKKDKLETGEQQADNTLQEAVIFNGDPGNITRKNEVETRPRNRNISEHASLKTKFFNGNLTPQEKERLNYLEKNMERLRQKEDPRRQIKIKENIAELKRKEQLKQDEENRLKKLARPWWKRIFSSRI